MMVLKTYSELLSLNIFDRKVGTHFTAGAALIDLHGGRHAGKYGVSLLF